MGKVKNKKTLVIVESATKANTIKRFLSSNYKVQASNGHLIDLPKSKFGIDIEQGFIPSYITIRGRGEILKKLKDSGKKADKILLAADPDREGEAICWHLGQALNLKEDEYNRIEFNEITKSAIKEAVKNPRKIDGNRVDAQQTRRILDRIVGYLISPLLWKKVKKGLSAGRVQSVGVSLITDREEEIDAFIPEEYWSVDALLKTLAMDKKGSEAFPAALQGYKGEKIKISDESKVKEILDELKDKEYKINKITSRQVERKPSAPFITSTMQQEASQKLNFNTRKTMQIAQQLYEGVKLGEGGMTGLVTYIRTDSVKISDTAAQQATEYIKNKLGDSYLPEKPHFFKSSKRAQEAHEAIRPADITRTPDSIKDYLTKDQHRLYKLIWNRFMASRTASAKVHSMSVDIAAGDYNFRATGSNTLFEGFLVYYRREKNSGEADKVLPPLTEGEALSVESIKPEQHFTQPPPRYNEASLVKALEEKEIGRPSTYSPIIETIRGRGYVTMDNKAFVPTELGKIVVSLLKEYFPEIIDVEFTARLEESLDDVEDGKRKGIDVLKDFYGPFEKRLKYAEAEMKDVELEPEYSDEDCPKCEKKLVYRFGRFGRFLACSGFPECRYTRNIKSETGVKCPVDKGDIVEKRSRKGRLFYGCSNYPECTFSLWQKPLKEECEVCGYFMIEKDKKKSIVACGNPECKSSQ